MAKCSERSSRYSLLKTSPLRHTVKKWGLVPLLMAVPFLSEGLNRVVQASNSFPVSGTPVEVTIEMLFLALLGVYICRRAEERREILDALQRSEQRYRAVVEDQTELICRFLPDGTITFANEAYCRLVGHGEEELIGRSFMGWIPNGDREMVSRDLSSLRPTKSTCILEHRLVGGKGQILDYQCTYRATFHQEGTVRAIQAVGQDVTERKRMEIERERLVDQLKTQKAELEMFSRSVSHDLKSPLITIRGFLRVLERDALSGKTDRLQEVVRRMDTSAARLEQLADQLRELSSIGSVESQTSEISFEQLAREAVELVHGRITERGVKVRISPDLPLLLGDHSRLLQVMQNLIENAVKYMGDQSHPKVEIGAIEDHGEMLCFVRDNGTGIDPSRKDEVFALFTRLDHSSDGTGLGLALVQRIIEAHGGRIWVESDGRGKGSTFYFSLNSQAQSHHDV